MPVSFCQWLWTRSDVRWPGDNATLRWKNGQADGQNHAPLSQELAGYKQLLRYSTSALQTHQTHTKSCTVTDDFVLELEIIECELKTDGVRFGRAWSRRPVASNVHGAKPCSQLFSASFCGSAFAQVYWPRKLQTVADQSIRLHFAVCSPNISALLIEQMLTSHESNRIEFALSRIIQLYFVYR